MDNELSIYKRDITGKKTFDDKEKILASKKLKSKYKFPYKLRNIPYCQEMVMRTLIECDIPLFLHGKSSDGKSARVKELDPDCVVIYLQNASPESLNGKSIYNSANGYLKDIPPTWYEKLVEKCESEPNKIHIVFFDELTNALPSIQGMAYNIILDKEINGKWHLPNNARIVAAGNEMSDSLAAYEMPKLLANRFAHIYIETKVDDWLKWAANANKKIDKINYKETPRKYKIHPSIINFISFKGYVGENVLRKENEKRLINPNPRKWEMASIVLEKTNNISLLKPIIGKEMVREFIKYNNDLSNNKIKEKYTEQQCLIKKGGK